MPAPFKYLLFLLFIMIDVFSIYTSCVKVFRRWPTLVEKVSEHTVARATDAECHMRRMQSVQNRALCMALDTPWIAWNQDTEMESIMNFIRRTAARLFEMIEDHLNPSSLTLPYTTPVCRGNTGDPGWSFSLDFFLGTSSSSTHSDWILLIRTHKDSHKVIYP